LRRLGVVAIGRWMILAVLGAARPGPPDWQHDPAIEIEVLPSLERAPSMRYV
jgi:hypothetical protein